MKWNQNNFVAVSKRKKDSESSGTDIEASSIANPNSKTNKLAKKKGSLKKCNKKTFINSFNTAKKEIMKSEEVSSGMREAISNNRSLKKL
jgi:hypothetical protein